MPEGAGFAAPRTARRTAAVLVAAGAAFAAATGAVAAADGSYSDRTGSVRTRSNLTGNGRDVIVTHGATGADTVTSNSAAGGNANHPERAVPNGSGGGGGGGGR